jgi:hypothetical protein
MFSDILNPYVSIELFGARVLVANIWCSILINDDLRWVGSESGPNQIKDHGRGPTGTDDFGGAKRKLDQPPVITIQGSKHRSSPEMMGAEDGLPLIHL